MNTRLLFMRVLRLSHVLFISCLVPLFLLAGTFFAAVHASALDSDETIGNARLSEANGDWGGAIEHYKNYLQLHPDSAQVTQVTTRMSVLQEALRHDDSGEELRFYLDALDAREARDVDGAREKLVELMSTYPGSYLRDDALYLQGYIAMMDAYQYEDSHALFHRLTKEFPDSTYVDTALYSEAISLEQLGNTEGAKKVFAALRERHTEFSLAVFGAYWPKSTYLSRYWFDRANNRLELLDEREQNAARLVARAGSKDPAYEGYENVVDVEANGRRMRLLLRESGVMSDTELDNEGALTLALSEAKFYSGIVENDEQSWVRVMIRGQQIEGIVETGGERMQLEPFSMMGTLDYYKPDDGKPGDIEALKLHDYAMQPPPEMIPSDPVPELSNEDGSGDGSYSQPQDNNEPQLGAVVSSGVSRLVRMDVYVDSQYNDYYGGDGLLQAMSALNVADGIYRQHFGLALEIGNATVFTDRNNDPMNLGAVTLESSLRKFRDLRLANKASSGDIGLSYLFSGNKNVDEAIGLAWIGAVCRNDGFDVGITTPSSYADLLVTHEIGHSLGALHDTDTSCGNERNLLMWPRISGTTTQNFSGCSRTSVNSGVSKSCLLNTIDLSLDVQPMGSTGFAAVVTNHDTRSTAEGAGLVLETAVVNLDFLPANCAESGPGELACSLSTLAPGASEKLEFVLAPTGSGDLHARIAAGSFYDVMSGNNQAQLVIDPANGGLTSWRHTVANDNSPGQTGNAGNLPSAAASDSDASGASGGGGSSDWWLLVSALISSLLVRAQLPVPG